MPNSSTLVLTDGNDTLFLANNLASHVVTLGLGRDRIEFGERYFKDFEDLKIAPVVVTDFTPGAQGDVLDLIGLLIVTNWLRVSNPFADGFLRLLQRGADTLVAVDLDGKDGSNELLVVLRLEGVDERQLSAENFTGFDPARAPIVGNQFTGATGNDFFIGSSGSDSILGDAGSDALYGGLGNDTLDGAGDQDTLSGGYGNDLLRGGAGDDQLDDLNGGSDTIIAGDGNDRITISHRYFADAFDVILIDAGAGDDQARFAIGDGQLVADMGAGNDVLTLLSYPIGGSQISLGSGSDILVLDAALSSQVRGLITVTDFQPGDGGDQLEWKEFARYFSNLPADANPFGAGAAALVQVGANTALKLKQGSFETVVLFKDAAASAFTDFNFGVDIAALPPLPEPVTQIGTPGNDNLADLQGTLTINAGDGDDRIRVFVEGYQYLGPVGSLNAGNGNDALTFTYGGSYLPYFADLGAGDDAIRVNAVATDVFFTLGTGRDTIKLAEYFRTVNGSSINIADFTTGNEGDQVDFSEWIATERYFGFAFLGDRNPFAMGYLQLKQEGADVVLFLSRRGELEPSEFIRFKSTVLTSFTAANFGGFDPHVTPNVAKLITGDYTIAAGTREVSIDPTPILYASTHYYFKSAGGHFVNHGTVVAEGNRLDLERAELVGFYADASSSNSVFLNARDGVFSVVNNTQFFTYSFWVGTWGFNAASDITFQNEGIFSVAANGGSVRGISTGFSFEYTTATNSGTITVRAPTEATGIYLGPVGSVRNDGDILVEGGIYGIGVFANQYNTQSIVNTGTLTVRTDKTLSPWASIGILLPEVTAPYAGAYHHWNSGTIEADYTYYVFELNLHVHPNGHTDILHNSGTLLGSVALGRGADVVLNSGLITKRTFLGDGNDVYEGSRGVHTGSIEGDAGNDTLRGGADNDNLFGDSGSDLIDGGAGHDYIDGGSGSDHLDGGAGFDMLSYFDSLMPVQVDLAQGTATTALEIDLVQGFEFLVGSRGGDTLLGSDAIDGLAGFKGNDILDGRAGDDLLLGGQGADTLRGGAGADVFVFDKGDGVDEVSDFSAGDTINLYGRANWQSLVQYGADVLLTLSANDQVLFRNASLLDVQAAISFLPGVFDPGVPTFELQPLRVDADLVLDQNIAFGFGDTRPNVNFDVLPASTALFLASQTGLWSAGTLAISTASDVANTRAVAVVPGVAPLTQRLINQETGRLDASASASSVITVDGVNQVWNAGLITATSMTSDATGIGGLHPDGSLVVNTGSIIVSAAGMGYGVAQSMSSSIGNSHYVNAGTISVQGAAGGTGYDLRMSSFNANTRPTFVNSGDIIVLSEASNLDTFGIRINLSANVSLWNSGSISADYAIFTTPAISGSFSGMGWGLSIYNTGTLNGLVSLSGWNDVVINNANLFGGAFLANGHDLYDGRGGWQTGLIDGWDGNDTLLGGAGADKLAGGFGNDLLSGGAGDDWLQGSEGADRFRFAVGDGHDIVADFRAEEGDTIELIGYNAWLSATQTGADVLLAFAAQDTLLLQGTTVEVVVGAVRLGATQIAPAVLPSAPATPAAPAVPTSVEARIQSPVLLQGVAEQFGQLVAQLSPPPGSSPVSVSWQWYQDLVAINSATNSTLELTQARVGSVISAVANYVDENGIARSISSDPTTMVANINDSPTGAVTLSGSIIQGATLTAANTLADADGLGTISYQWRADGINISGTTNASFVLTQAQVGKAITVVASYTDGFGTAESQTSSASAAVANINDLPTGSVLISGNANNGASLLASNTLADIDGLGAISYQWKAGGINIAGATSSSYTLTQAEVGKAITVVASYTDSLGAAESVASNATAPVGDIQLNLQGMAYHWKSHMLLGQVNVQVSGQAGMSTSTPGTFELQGIASTPVALSASRGAGDTGSAITSADALAALRIATGVNPNPDPDGAGPQRQLKLSPYQVMAADVNKDGKVTSADALAILRMATNSATAPAKEWFFVKETQDLWNETTNSSALTRTATSWDSGLGNVALSSGANSLNLVGVLKGDVNGSWSAPVGSIDLDNTNPTYFQLLGAQMGQPMDVWGI